ncbi:protease synthase and sporulation protein PAI 2 [Siminovitchia terrae]|uniref:Protease synthase and sporulation protein PAI 2 n=1 Tax=Siminovitchia terrae TaxID=1914933 RepID=A0ABQ4KV89_SIMTE|nr:FMN-binding negative transcriptional regulator [Siminovitchia terrae]GIN95574.1 protease synthase and sporulation protein PAI 2 [Siminovitchia terrae]
MYIPKHFKISDKAETFEVMRNHSFATLFSTHQGLPFATHLPLILSEDGSHLSGHFARQNPQWTDIENQTVLAVFQGPHSYISPSWYETNQTVPTWNYVAVHVYGEMKLIDNEEEIMSDFRQMIDIYESKEGQYQMEDVDPKIISNLNKGVQAFKIHISHIEGKAKLSQNHSFERQNRVISQLFKGSNENDQQIARLMKKNLDID